MNSRTHSNKSSYSKGKTTMPAFKLMAFENEYHRHIDALLREVKRLRGEVGVLAKRYNGAKREIKELVERVMRQAPPPIPVRPEKKESREERASEEREKKEEKGDIEMKEAEQEENTPQKNPEPGELRGLAALRFAGKRKKEKMKAPPNAIIPSSAKLPEQVAATPICETKKTAEKRRFVETNNKVRWDQVRSKLEKRTGRQPTKSDIQMSALYEGVNGDKMLLLLPEREKGKEGYICRERKYEADCFVFGEFYARDKDCRRVWDVKEWEPYDGAE